MLMKYNLVSWIDRMVFMLSNQIIYKCTYGYFGLVITVKLCSSVTLIIIFNDTWCINNINETITWHHKLIINYLYL